MYEQNTSMMNTPERNTFLLPAMVEGDFSSDEIAEDADGLQMMSFQRVKIPAGAPAGCEQRVVDLPLIVGNSKWSATCVSVGNPHCVVFVSRVDTVDVPYWGPLFEHASCFPEQTNTEFIRVVNEHTIRMRVWERGNGETWSCGTGACAAAVAACEKGLCKKGEDITVQLKGGDLIVNYTDERILLTGNAALIYEGQIAY